MDEALAIAAAERAIKEMSPEWEKALTAILTSVIEDFGDQTIEDLDPSPKSEAKDPPPRFDTFSRSSREWISGHGAEAVRTIQKTNLSDVRKVLIAGSRDGLTMPQIGQKLKGFYADKSAYKSMRIARTEVSASAGFGQREAAKQSGVVKAKRWISSKDDRVRDAHFAIDGEERQLNELYSNGLMFPGDPSGSPDESIQCRCVEEYFSKEPKVREPEEVSAQEYKDNMKTSLTDFSRTYADSDIENLQAFDLKGNVIGKVNHGSANGVNFNTSHVDAWNADKISAVIHNHPNDVPIWIGDMKSVQAPSSNIRRFIVTTKDEISEFSAENWAGVHNSSSQALFRAQEEWYKVMGGKVDSSIWGKEAGYLDLCHKANEAAASSAGWVYKRAPIDRLEDIL